MSPEVSVTEWFVRLREGDGRAARPLWEHYFPRMVALARQRLSARPGRAADEEDVALSAFARFCHDAQRGRFPDVADRHDLWKLLIAITAHKSVDQARREQAAKRGGGRARWSEADLVQVIGREPTPEFAARVAEECERLLARLGDDTLRRVAVWKMEGRTNAEIAGLLGCVPRTVERRLEEIRQIWGEEGGDE
jgi:DNA-directed RNA polymerase specialized sigma24 family protein